MTLEKDASFVESRKKSKKRKHDKQEGSEHFIDDVNMSKDDEKIKKKRKKTEIHQGVGDTDVCNEGLDTTMNHPDHKENKKNKKLKFLEDKSLPSSDHVDKTLEGSDKSHKARKENKKHKKDECNLEMDDGNRKTEKVKKKKQKKEKDNGVLNGEKEANDQDGDLSKEFKKKRKREKKAMKDGLSSTENNNDVTDQAEKKSRKKTVESKNATEEVKKKKPRSKKVTFSSDVEVFPLDKEVPKKNKGQTLVQGKWFTLEENEKIKEAVYNYIKEHNLGEKGLDMIMHCKSYPQLKNCWKEIALALPYRPQYAFYKRAHVLFERHENRHWSKEDLDQIRKFHAEHGPKWKQLAEITGRHRIHIKDTWRRIRILKRKFGQWSQDEYQKLFDLVHIDLKLKVFAEKKSKHGMLRDNIGWTAISGTLTTRHEVACCLKWYGQLTSPMVVQGLWADSDDYLLMGILYKLDACSVEEVDWDNLIEHRSGDVCMKRWNQMVRYIGSHKLKSFSEQVELLSQRYRLDMFEAREIWDNKPYTD